MGELAVRNSDHGRPTDGKPYLATRRQRARTILTALSTIDPGMALTAPWEHLPETSSTLRNW